MASTVPACRKLRRPRPEGREARRTSRPGSHEVRVGYQSQDGKSARYRCPSCSARTCKRGDRITAILLHVPTAVIGTKRRSRHAQPMSAFGGKADITSAHSGSAASDALIARHVTAPEFSPRAPPPRNPNRRLWISGQKWPETAGRVGVWHNVDIGQPVHVGIS
jgi:hypothetical protein